MQQTTDAVFKDVAGKAEAIRSDHEEVINVMDPGDEVRQGDIYVTMLGGVPTDAAKVDRPQRQLAPGETQGSRHCLRSLNGITLYKVRDAGPLDGPVIEAREGMAVDHPEHGNRVFPPGVYAITYQRAFGEELRAVQD